MDGLHVLGPLEVVVEGVSRPLGGRRRRRLLSVLALWANTVVSNDRLVDLVWGADAEGGVLRSLRTEISRVRQSLDGLATVVAEGGGYRLEIDPDHMDVARFEALITDTAQAEGPDAVGVLDEALGLWRDDPFVEIADSVEAAVAEGQRLEGLWMTAVVRRAEAQLVVAGADGAALGEVVGQLRGLVEEHPLQERLWALLMLSLYRSGRQAEALTAFQQAREVLVEGLGLDPSEELVRLEQQILEHDPALDPAPREPAPTGTKEQATAPLGTVTFLFTDIEGSTTLWERHPDEMRSALERHDELIQSAVEAHGGYVFSATGDGFAVAFARADDAVTAAHHAQEALSAVSWPTPTPILVRMGLHTGEAQERDGNYFGPALNRAARIMSAGHGGQMLVSSTTSDILGPTELVDLGEHRLKDLSSPEHLHQLGQAVFPPLSTLDVVRHNLPVQTTSLLGRESEVDRVASFLSEHRLVTLAGVGGVGKTRLGLASAAEVADRFADGVFLVELAGVTSGDSVVPQITAATGIDAAALTTEDDQLGFLARRDVLLVLDNCEHVIDDVAAAVEIALETGERARVLATSREPLAVAGEHVVGVGPLAVGGPGGVAERLLRERAIAAGAEAGAIDRAPESMTSICVQLDGIPLALELAAAQLVALSPADLSARLDQRFELLSGGRRRRRQRQHTLQAVMDWSWETLDDKERQLLARLAVFAGRWTLDAAEHVAGTDSAATTAPTLGSLVTKSLVAVHDSNIGRRYQMLETVRLYAQQKLANLGLAEGQWRTHAMYFSDTWSTVPLSRRILDAPTHAASLLADLDNLRSAIDWHIDNGQPAAALEIAVAFPPLERVLGARSVAEIDDWLERLRDTDMSIRDQALLILYEAMTRMRAKDSPTHDLARQAHDLALQAGDLELAAISTLFQGWRLTRPEHLQELQDLMSHGAELALQAGDHWLADELRAWATGVVGMSDPSTQSLDMLRSLATRGSSLELSMSARHAVLAASILGDNWTAGQQAMTEVSQLWNDSHIPPHLCWPVPYGRSLIAAFQGDRHETQHHLRQAVTMFRAMGGSPKAPDFALPVAAIAAANSQPATTRSILRAVRSSDELLSYGVPISAYRRLRSDIGPDYPNDPRIAVDLIVDNFLTEAHS